MAAYPLRLLADEPPRIPSYCRAAVNSNAVSPEERARICATYKRTGNVARTAREHKRSLKTVTRQLRLAGVEIKRRSLDTEDEKKIVSMYVTREMPLRAIAAQTGVSYGTVHRVVKAADVMRRRGTTGRIRAVPDPAASSAVPGGTAEVPEAVAASA